MIFRQLLDTKSATFSYLLADEGTREAVLLDSVFEQHARDAALLLELGLRLIYTLETHVHADHVTGAWLMKERFGSRIAVSVNAHAKGADLLVAEGDIVRFGNRSLHVLSTPGHTNGCVTYVLDDRSMAFTGDALLIRGAGRTDFQEGDARTLYRSVREKIFSLPDETLLYPAHDYAGRLCTSVWEERRYNPRLGGERSEGDFVGFMDNLGLPVPKQMDVAIPANLESGKPASAQAPHTEAAWAPVVRTYAGVPEVDAHWVAEHAHAIQIVDVREPSEFAGELGHIPEATLVPLASLRATAAAFQKEKPVVVVCRSGGRSSQAALMLEQQGFTKVANLSGGMIRWRDAGFPVTTSPDVPAHETD